MESSSNPSPSKTPDSPMGVSSKLRNPKAVLIAVSVLFIILLSILAISPSSKKKPSSQLKVPAHAAAQVTDTEFLPGTITITAGTQVTWTNKGQHSHQVSADPYPLDNSISGFNSSQVLLPGDSLTFSFETKGTYHLHDNLNYLNTSLRQTIIVK